jgi:hypothetical protein
LPIYDGFKLCLLGGLSAALLACAPTSPAALKSAPSSPETAAFAGRYNGNSFETAMGMRLEEDGTFVWGLSVGALDMSARGRWTHKDGAVHFTSDPQPAAPEWRWSGLERGSEGILLKTTFPDGTPFTHASAVAECADGSRSPLEDAGSGVFPLGEACSGAETGVAAIVIEETVLRQTAKRFDLSALGWSAGETFRAEFKPNDWFIADFTGASGRMEEGELVISGLQFPLRLRKSGSPPAE